MNVIDYRSADGKPPTSLWRRRYLVGVTLVGVGYCFALWRLSNIANQYTDDTDTVDLPMRLRIISGILCSPMGWIHLRTGSDLLDIFLFVFINAATWGFSVVGLWHLIWVIVRRRVKPGRS